MTIEPAAEGMQLVRTSLPFPKGTLKTDQSIVVKDGDTEIPVAVRPLTFYGGDAKPGLVRRAMVTFPYRFADGRPLPINLYSVSAIPASENPMPVEIHVADDHWSLAYPSGLTVRARPLWPKLEDPGEWHRETIEHNRYFRWERWKRQNDEWGQIVESRADVLGQVVLIAHLQRRDAKGDWTPRFGWDLTVTTNSPSDDDETHKIDS